MILLTGCYRPKAVITVGLGLLFLIPAVRCHCKRKLRNGRVPLEQHLDTSVLTMFIYLELDSRV